MSAYETKEWLQHYPEWTPHSLEYGDTTLLDVYDNNLAINADKPATYFSVVHKPTVNWTKKSAKLPLACAH